MISFELSKEIEKEVFSSCHGGRGGGLEKKQRKILSPHAKSNLRSLDSALQWSNTEPQRFYGDQGALRSSYMTPVLHTAKISNVDSV